VLQSAISHRGVCIWKVDASPQDEVGDDEFGM
jgi:hypothetical protein